MAESRIRPVSDEEMEHYLMFPDAYCRGCEGGMAALCDRCLNDEAMVDRFYPASDDEIDCDPHRTVTHLDEHGVPHCYLGHPYCWDEHSSERAADEADWAADMEWS